MRSPEDLLAEINRSGFPLQLGVEELVKTRSAFDWEVRYTEHRWQHPVSNAHGFIDMVLTQSNGVGELVVECKRVQETEWTFLKEATAQPKTGVRGLVALNEPRRNLRGWHDLHAKLSSPECEFCTGIGEDPKARPMLERLAATVVEATEGLAAEDMQHTFPSIQRSPMRVYFPVIVTNAALKVCSYEKSEIDLATGTLKSANIEDARFLRFRKQVGGMPSNLPNRGTAFDPNLVARAKESTVFIVNVNHLEHFLGHFEVFDQQLRQIFDSPER
jgi:hypothetical protein